MVMTTGQFNAKQISNEWIEKLDQALARGYDGMRVNGNEAWLERNGWEQFHGI
jgi:MEDS: MEthanogen/methylotroph, DcmR Sensory domain